MRPGTIMSLNFNIIEGNATFLPRNLAKSIPFSSNRLTEIFKLFSVVEQGSFEANALKETIELCERPGKGEEKYCTTSLESMIDFNTSKLGTRNVQAVSTELLEKGVIKSLRKYTALPGVKKLGGDEAVSCHRQRYPFPVFYCHSTKQTANYVMSMKGADGEKVKAVAMCHIDTSGRIWHMGTVPGLTFSTWKAECLGFHSDVSIWHIATALTFSPSAPFIDIT
ncbi:hypothetical protein CerSpe_121850 [Prunus speciosa]